MYCIQCGKKGVNPDLSGKFCNLCGDAVSIHSQASTQSNPVYPSYQPPAQREQKVDFGSIRPSIEIDAGKEGRVFKGEDILNDNFAVANARPMGGIIDPKEAMREFTRVSRDRTVHDADDK